MNTEPIAPTKLAEWKAACKEARQRNGGQKADVYAFANIARTAMPRLIERVESLETAVEKMSHRRCRDCEHVAYYLSYRIADCACEQCGSPDTRQIHKATKQEIPLDA